MTEIKEIKLGVKGESLPLIAIGICPDCKKIMGKCGCDTVSGYNPGQVIASEEELRNLPAVLCNHCRSDNGLKL